MRRLEGTNSEFDDDDVAPPVEAPIVGDEDPDTGTVTPASQKVNDGVKFDRFEIKVPEAGENKIPAYRVNRGLPLMFVLGAIALVLWILVPGGIQILRPAAIPDAYADASARWVLAVTKERIDQFVEVNGRLPQSLEEIDVNLSQTVTYQGISGGGYVLHSPGHEQLFTLQSDMPLEGFMGRTAEELRHKPGTAK